MTKYSKTNERIIAEITELQNKKGIIDPEDVVERARDKKSAMHNEFTWDDTEAARLHRIEEAKKLLRVTVIYITNEKGKEIEVRAFVSLPVERGKDHGSYRTIESVLSNTALYSQLLEMAIGDLRAFQKKYEMLQCLKRFMLVIETEIPKLLRKQV